jgi:MFS family permease
VGPEPTTGFGSLVRNRRFVLWMASVFCGGLGYFAWSISVLWLAYQLTGNLVVTALVLSVQYTIYAITFIAGPFVDRVSDKRRIYLVVYPIEAATVAVVGFAIRTGTLSVALLLASVVVMAILDDFWWTADNTVPPMLVSKENLLVANGLMTAAGGGSSIAGYSLGAVLLVIVGPSAGAFLFALLLVAAALLVAPVVLRSASTSDRRLLSNFLEGWSFLGRGKGRPLLQLGVVLAAEGLFLAAPPLLITLLSNRLFSNPGQTYGILFTAYVVGSLVGGLALGRANPRRHLGVVLVGAVVVQAAGLALALLFVPFTALDAGAWFVVGVATSIPSTVIYAFLQGTTPSDTIGRAVSNLYLFPGIASAVGAVAFGALSIVLAPLTFGYAIVLGILLAGVLIASVPFVWRLRL